MNSRAGTKPKRRQYDNRLREEQAQLTQQRILDTVTKKVAAGTLDFTISEVARSAGVSEPTIYRHFGSRERLYDALDEHIRQQIGLPMACEDASGLPATAKQAFLKFSEHGTLFRAASKTGLGRKVREQAKVKRNQQVRDVLAPRCEHLPGVQTKAVAAVYRVLMSLETWDRLTSEFAIDSTTAAEAVAWAIDSLNDKLAADRDAQRSSLSIDDEEETP